MSQRLLSAAVLVPAVVILFVLGPPWLTLGICVLGILGAYETAQLVRRAGFGASTVWPVIWTPLAIFAFAWGAEPSFELNFMLVAPGLAVLILVAAVPAVLHAQPADGLRAWLGTIVAGLYPGMLGFAAVLVGIGAQPPDSTLFGYHLDSGRILLLFLVVTVWTLDSAAYVVGRYYPRGRFMPHISPNKTWSGAIGGTVAAIAVSVVIALGAGWPVVGGALAGAVVAMSAQLGDLAESMLKRAAGAKDSGSLIPGHGGVLDRLDSFLFAAPALYAALVLWLGLAAISPDL